MIRLEHQRLHEKHRGHESMHAEMALILIATLIVAQILLVQWKTRHFKSYQVIISSLCQKHFLFSGQGNINNARESYVCTYVCVYVCTMYVHLSIC